MSALTAEEIVLDILRSKSDLDTPIMLDAEEIVAAVREADNADHKLELEQIVKYMNEWGIHDHGYSAFNRGLHLMQHLARGGTLEQYGLPEGVTA